MTSTQVPFTIWYLAMEHEHEHVKKPLSGARFKIRECLEKQFEINRFFYQFVGCHWDWTDKLSWDDEQWQAYAEAPDRRTWIAYVDDSPAGYFELSKNEDNVVELDYFGLASRFVGRGYGGGFLSFAIEAAWQWGAQRVQVNTCSKDHPDALANYQARGFSLYKTITR
ncbi:GNAT family N-acetyltransferase [Endozoicomonas lisbonensis]|uniref:GNAT superfamily N-acetyltransferase n=1 Tax=Endozoicomonas lisbonensis TaxID=3120522 RepID=A0ABV2SLJ6_9GAMM